MLNRRIKSSGWTVEYKFVYISSFGGFELDHKRSVVDCPCSRINSHPKVISSTLRPNSAMCQMHEIINPWHLDTSSRGPVDSVL
jgi:hypothetical protein